MTTQDWPDGRVAVLLSAHAEDLLASDAAAIADYLRRHPAEPAQVAATLRRTRRVRRHRALIRAADSTELATALQAVAAGNEHTLVTRGTEINAAAVAFVFPGQGSQWPGMGTAPYAQLPAYRGGVDECVTAFRAAGHPAPLDYLIGARADYTEIEVEGAQFAHHLGLAAVWRACGVLPDMTVGHSLGEIAAACVANAMTLTDAVTVVAARAGVVDRLSGSYAVAALGIDADAARELIHDTPGWLELSVINGPTAVAISGDRAPVLAAVQTVRDRGGFGREITVNFPVHTSVLEPLRTELAGQWPDGEFAESPVDFIGGTTGDAVERGTRFADYWYTNLRRPVRFDHAVQSAVRRGAQVFIEMSAHPALLFAMTQMLGDTALVVGSGHRDQAPADRLSAALAAVAVTGATAEPHAGGAPLRGFPPAPMRAVHLWTPPAIGGPDVGRPRADTATVAAERWREVPVPQTVPQGSAAVLAHPDHALACALRSALAAAGVTEAPAAQAHTLFVLAPSTLATPEPRAALAALAEWLDRGTFRDSTPGPQCRRVCLITVRAERTGPTDEPALPGQAALAAIHRSAAHEHPDVEYLHLDLPSADIEVTPLLGALSAGSGTTAARMVAGRITLLRRGFQWVPADRPATPAALDEVVITGGSGAIAGHYAAALAGQGARRIVLLSRRGTDPHTLAALSARYDTEWVSVPCDLTDEAAVAAVAVARGGDGATLLIHTAGAATFRPADELDGAALIDNCAAKVLGLDHLLAHWPVRADARILLCSSVSGLWGGRDHAGYAAANRMLDVQAAQRRAAGANCTAVRWGLWQGPGIVNAQEAAAINRSGLLPMDPADAIAAAATATVDPLVYTADAQRLGMFLDTGPEAPADTEGLSIDNVVRTELAAVLDFADSALLDLDTALFDLGVDSLLAVDLRKRLKRRLGRTVPLATLLGGVTGRGVVSELATEKVNAAGD